MRNFNGREIEFFSWNEEKISFHPKEGFKMIFKHETKRGEFGEVDMFFIVQIDQNGVEQERHYYPVPSISFIRWKSAPDGAQ